MDNMLGWSRRSVLAAGLVVSASWLVGRSQAQTPESVMTRPIPHSGEQLPVVGLGTAVSFPSANESQRAALKDVIDALVAGGGKRNRGHRSREQRPQQNIHCNENRGSICEGGRG
jgi:hypothetical protein